MNDNDLRNVSDDDYRRLMAEAYPASRRDLAAAVMAQITAEAGQSAKKAKILTPAFRNRLVKFGSMAACLVLLVTLGFRVVPMMKNAVTESADSAAPEAVMYSAAGTSGNGKAASPETSVRQKTLLTDDAADALPAEEPAAALHDSAAAEECIPEEAPEAEEAEEAPAPPMLMMAPPPAAAEEAVPEEACAEECITEECVTEEPACADADAAVPEYYRFDSAPDEAEGVRRTFEYELKLRLYGEVSRRPGEDVCAVWMRDHGYTDAAGWSLAEFVTDHGISRERFTELYGELAETFAEMYPGYAVPTYDLDKMYSMDEDITASITSGTPGCLTDELYRGR